MIKTTTLEMSKMLKDEGFRKATNFYYVLKKGNKYSIIDSRISCGYYHPIPAPITDELLEDITSENLMSYYARNIQNGDTSLGDLYVYTTDILNLLRNPDELAKCWLWLKKEGLI